MTRIRVAAYCRISTDREEQQLSLSGQKCYFEDYINKNPSWIFHQIYADEGVTGTSVRKRTGFCKMLEDARKGRFDLLLTKEISRFARNTLDSIYYTRELKQAGIGIIFLNDGINTMDPDAELRLTILSSIAQEESRKTSQRVIWGQKRRMEQGVVFGRDLLGYHLKNGSLSINPKEAQTVRTIFAKYLEEGKGAGTIARDLEQNGILTARGNSSWSQTAVLRILKNEKYCGDLIQKKTLTEDYLSHKKKVNHGQEPYIILKDHHPAIISRELFNQVQAELHRRSRCTEKKTKYSSCHCFSGKIRCGICHMVYVSRRKTLKNGRICQSWRCHTAVKYGKAACPCPTVKDSAIKKAAGIQIDKLEEINRALKNRLTAVLFPLLGEYNDTAEQKKKTVQLNELSKKQERLIELYLEEKISSHEFEQMRKKYQDAAEKLKSTAVSIQPNHNHISRKDQINDLLDSILFETSWNDVFYRTMIDHIMIRENGTIHIQLAGSEGLTTSLPDK